MASAREEGFYHSIESMAVDPNDDQLVYMVAGMYVSDKPNGRLYISTDRGDNWQHVDLPFSAGGNNQGRAVGERLMVDPNNPSTLFYGSRTAGLWKSPDRGQTWHQVASLSPPKMTQDQINATDGRRPIGVEQVIFDTSTKGSGTRHADHLRGRRARTMPARRAWAPTCTSPPTAARRGPASRSPPTSTAIYIPHMVRAKDGMIYVAFTKGTRPRRRRPGVAVQVRRHATGRC